MTDGSTRVAAAEVGSPKCTGSIKSPLLGFKTTPCVLPSEMFVPLMSNSQTEEGWSSDLGTCNCSGCLNAAAGSQEYWPAFIKWLRTLTHRLSTPFRLPHCSLQGFTIFLWIQIKYVTAFLKHYTDTYYDVLNHAFPHTTQINKCILSITRGFVSDNTVFTILLFDMVSVTFPFYHIVKTVKK